MQTIAVLIEQEKYTELHALVLDYIKSFPKMTVRKYCQNAVIDASLSTYIHKAERKGIMVTAELDFPETFPAPPPELAMVFANALENAIHACEVLDAEDRKIRIKVMQNPNFMFKISNRYNGVITLNDNGIPTNSKEGHGYGVRSIIAFCEKYDAYYHFSIKEKVFSLTVGM